MSQALKENTYPFLAVIVLRENRMTVVAKIEGPIGESLLSYAGGSGGGRLMVTKFLCYNCNM